MYEAIELAQFLGASWSVSDDDFLDAVLLDVLYHFRVHAGVTVIEHLATFDADDFLRVFIHKVLHPFLADMFCEEHTDAVLWCDGLFEIIFSEHNCYY